MIRETLCLPFWPSLCTDESNVSAQMYAAAAILTALSSPLQQQPRPLPPLSPSVRLVLPSIVVISGNKAKQLSGPESVRRPTNFATALLLPLLLPSLQVDPSAR